MIVQEIRVQNYRSIRSASLHCERLTALVGRNGAGKSSFLKALELFYDPGAKVSTEDFYAEDTEQDIEIALTYCNLNSEEEDFFSAYLDNGTLTVTRLFSLSPGKRSGTYHGARFQNPDFSSVRNADGKREITAGYNELRGKEEYSDLPPARSADVALEALISWESGHPEVCVRMRDDGQFFGFTGVGQGYLGRHTHFIRIPAVRDASEEAADRRGSFVTELMDLVVRSALARRPEVAVFKEETLNKYREVFDPAKLLELSELEGRLSETLKHYAPDSDVSLGWTELADIDIPMPRAEVKLVEDGYPASVLRSGHGLQRAFILTMLQHLVAARDMALPAAQGAVGGPDEVRARTHLPSFLLAIEEPELYQHPSRQRHLASVLLKLATGAIPGVAENTQVLYSTHSPLFVGLDRFDQIRLLRKQGEAPGRPMVTMVAKADLADVAGELFQAAGRKGVPYTAQTLNPRMQALMTPWMNEGFFADVVALVEGEDDRAAIIGVATYLNYDLDGLGICVIPCSGKQNIDRPLLVFRQLRIPTYVLWDGDCGGKDAKPEDNRRLLRLVGEQEEDWPEAVGCNHACFKSKLEDTLAEEIGPDLFSALLEEAQKELHVPKREHALKTPAVITMTIERAALQGKRCRRLEEIVANLVALRRQGQAEREI